MICNNVAINSLINNKLIINQWLRCTDNDDSAGIRKRRKRI